MRVARVSGPRHDAGHLPVGPRPAPLLVTVALLVLGGCIGGRSGPRGPVVSPTGIVYEPGTPPVETRFSQTAALYLRSEEPDRALDLALQGVQAERGNPIHYFLAGVAHARLGAYQAADTMLAQAQRMYPAYELDIEPERHAAWADAFNRGTEAYAAGDTDEAIRLWKGAVTMYRLRPEAHRNLATLLTQEGRLDEAAAVYSDLLEGMDLVPATRVLAEPEVVERRSEAEQAEGSLSEVLLLTERFAEAEPLLRSQLARDPESPRLRMSLASALSGQGRAAEAHVIYEALLADDALTEAELLNLGVALFRAGDARRATEAFRKVTEVKPDSRDAWYNYANALLADQAWETLVGVADRLLAVDPLGENTGLIVARAFLETGDERGALEHLHRVDELPVLVDGLVMRRAGAATLLEGRVTGKVAAPGTEVRLRFTFYGDLGETDTETVLVPAPAQGETHTFEVSVGMRATAYRYAFEPPGS